MKSHLYMKETFKDCENNKSWGKSNGPEAQTKEMSKAL